MTATMNCLYPEEADDFKDLVGRKWGEVKSLDSDAPCLLAHDAFHYFFPSIIRLSQINLRRSDLLVLSTVYLLAEIEAEKKAEKLRRWDKDRFRAFTDGQLKLIFKWLSWLKAEGWGKDSSDEELEQALCNVRRLTRSCASNEDRNK